MTSQSVYFNNAGKANRYGLLYDHEFFLLRNSSKALQGLGLKAGLHIEYDRVKYSENPIFAGKTTIDGVSSSGVSASIPGEVKVYETYLSGVLGFTYRYPISKYHQFDLGWSRLQGKGQGKWEYKTYGILLVPYEIEYKNKFKNDVGGTLQTLGYTATLSDSISLRISYETQKLTHVTKSARTRAAGPSFSLTANDLGPLPTTEDKLRSIGLEVQIKF